MRVRRDSRTIAIMEFAHHLFGEDVQLYIRKLLYTI